MTDNEIWDSITAVWDVEGHEILQLKHSIDSRAVTELVRVLGSTTDRVFTTGAGTSAVAAKKIAHTLSCVGVPTVFLTPSDAVHGGLGALRVNDIVIAPSKGGNTRDVVQMIPGIKGKKAKLVAVTEDKDSILAQNADHVLMVKVRREACPFNMLATSSILAVIAVFDAIASTLMTLTGYTKEDFLLIHPSGAVGERLRKELDKE